MESDDDSDMHQHHEHDEFVLDDDQAIELVERERREQAPNSLEQGDQSAMARRGLDLVRIASLARIPKFAIDDAAETPELGELSSADTRDDRQFQQSLLNTLQTSYQPNAADPNDSLPRIGHFEILRELGRGGFGVVLLARDPMLDRLIALKIPRFESFGSQAARKRFEREAYAVAMLTHPGIVPLLETRLDGPIQYIAFAYVPGESLAEYLKRQTRPLPIRLAAKIVATLAGAVEHSHQRGVIHRDLKPNNILLANPEGKAHLSEQELVNSLQITDFGLAKIARAGEVRSLTREGAIIGTPAYMAPEQASGEDDVVGPSSDTWSLGAILYELLTGRPPFQAAWDLATLRLIEKEEPQPPRKVNSAIPADLQAICLKCLEKRPVDRYARTADLESDLNRWIEGLPVKALPVSTAGRLWRWTNRNRALAVALGFAFFTLAVGLGVALVQTQMLHQRLEQVNREKSNAEAQRLAAIEQQEIANSIRGFLFDDLLRGADTQYQITQINRAQALGLGKLSYQTNPSIHELVSSVLPNLEASQLERRFPGQPLVQAELLSTVSRLLIQQGQFESALPIVEQLILSYQSIVGEGDDRLLDALYMKAVVFGGLGRIEESHDLHSRLLTLQEQHQTPWTLKVRTLYSLAAASTKLGQLDTAQSLLEKISETEQAFHEGNVSHVNVRRAINVLAHFHLTNGNHEQAQQLITRHYPDLALDTRLSGESLAIDLEVLDSLEYFAECESRSGNHERASRLFEQVVASRTTLLGESHSNTLLSRMLLAKSQLKTKQFAESIASHRALLPIVERAVGSDSNLAIVCTSNLANAFWSAGEYEQAIPLQRKLLQDALNKNPGGVNVSSLLYMANLGCSLRDARQHQESIELLEKVIEQGNENPALNWVQHELIWAYERAGKHDKAESLCRSWLDQLRAADKTVPQQLVKPLSSLGRNLLALGKVEEAELVFRELKGQIDSGALPNAARNWLCQESMALLGASLLEEQLLEQAGPLLESSCRNLESNLPPPAFHQNVAICYQHLAR